MANIMKLMKQAASMQKEMERVQKELAEKTVDFSSGGGMVTAVARGDMTIEKISIDARVVDPDDVEMLEDLVTAAVEGALQAAREMASRDMQGLTSGLGLPGMNLPM